MRANKRLVDMEDFERAKDKIYMGAERKSMVLTEDESAPRHITNRAMPSLPPVCPRPTQFQVTIIPVAMRMA